MMKRLTVAILGLFALTACNGGPNQTNIELIQNMMDQVSIKSQDWDQKTDEGQMRIPPEHTVARGKPPYKFATDPQGANKDVNPFANDRSPEFLTFGAKYYGIYCAVCHGASGEGNGTVAVQMSVQPRNLMSDAARAYTDGHIYYVITMGIGVMGSYASQIPDSKTRWAIVNYIRSMQKK
jgi:cytochrome c553